jgi:hypothetical protein
VSTHSSRCAARRPSLSSLFRFLAEWTRPHAPVVRPRVRPYLEILETRITPTKVTGNFYLVTSTADNMNVVTSGTGTSADPFLAPSLRSAVASADADGGADTIAFAPSIAKGVISLTLPPLNPPSGIFPGPTAFDVAHSLMILGSGQTITRSVDAGNFRLFFVEATGNLSLSNITLTNGLAKGGDGASGGGAAAGMGGAIYNRGALTVQGVTFIGNSAAGGAGGAGNNNSGYGGGGGLGGSGNTAGNGGTPNGGGFNGGGGFGGGGGGGSTGHGGGTGGFGAGGGPGSSGYGGGAGGFGGGGGGGGAYGGGAAAPGFGGGGGAGGDNNGYGGGGGGGGAFGGAIFSEKGNVTITNSTLFGNSVTGGDGGASNSVGNGGSGGAGFGGAVFAVDGTLTITNSTLSGNTIKDGASKGIVPAIIIENAPRGRDVYITANLASATAVINNSMLEPTDQMDSSFTDFSAGGGAGTSSTGGNNLIHSAGNFGGSFSTADPMLDPNGPQDNGGLTPTIALLAGSPAIDAGSNSVPNLPATDQRGFPRPDAVGTNVDIGAFESAQVQPPNQPATITSQSAMAENENSTFTVVLFGSNFAQGATVTFGAFTITPDSVTPTQLSFTVSEAVSLAADEGRVNITVVNPGQAPSNAAVFVIQEELIPGETRDSNHLFLSEALRDLMRHTPNLSDINFYTGLLAQGMTRTQVIHAIEFEPVHHEFFGLEINDAYERFLHRGADSVAFSSWVPYLMGGNGMPSHTLEQMEAALVGSPEYQMNNSGDYLNAFFQDALSRSATTADRQQAQGRTPQQAATAVFAGDEFRQLLLNAYYQQYLDHGYTPSAANPLSTAFPVGEGSEDVIASIIGEPMIHEFFNKTAL